MADDRVEEATDATEAPAPDTAAQAPDTTQRGMPEPSPVVPVVQGRRVRAGETGGLSEGVTARQKQQQAWEKTQQAGEELQEHNGTRSFGTAFSPDGPVPYVSRAPAFHPATFTDALPDAHARCGLLQEP